LLSLQLTAKIEGALTRISIVLFTKGRNFRGFKYVVMVSFPITFTKLTPR